MPAASIRNTVERLYHLTDSWNAVLNAELSVWPIVPPRPVRVRLDGSRRRGFAGPPLSARKAKPAELWAWWPARIVFTRTPGRLATAPQQHDEPKRHRQLRLENKTTAPDGWTPNSDSLARRRFDGPRPSKTRPSAQGRATWGVQITQHRGHPFPYL
jgi:hypothetical protein